MEVKNKVIHYNIAQQMNAQKPAGYRQDGGRHSAGQSNNDSAASSVQIGRDEKSVIPAKAGIQRTKELDSRLHGNDGLGEFSGENAINTIRNSFKNALLTVEEFMNRGISLEIERELGVIIVKIIDKESGELVRQIPFEEALEISKHLKARLEEMVKKQGGLFIDKEI